MAIDQTGAEDLSTQRLALPVPLYNRLMKYTTVSNRTPVDAVTYLLDYVEKLRNDLTDVTKEAQSAAADRGALMKEVDSLRKQLQDFTPIQVKAPAVILPNVPGHSKPEGPYKVQWADEERVCYSLDEKEQQSPGTMVMLSPNAVKILDDMRKASNGELPNWNKVIEYLYEHRDERARIKHILNENNVIVDLNRKQGAVIAELQKRDAEQDKIIADARGYLIRVLESQLPYVQTDFSVKWEPLPDLMGVCSQVDNFWAGIRTRIDKQTQRLVESRAASGHSMIVTDDGGNKTEFKFAGNPEGSGIRFGPRQPSEDEMRKEAVAAAEKFKTGATLDTKELEDDPKWVKKQKAIKPPEPTPVSALKGRVKSLRASLVQLIECSGRIGRSSVEERERLSKYTLEECDALLVHIEQQFPQFEKESKELEEAITARLLEQAKREFVEYATVTLAAAHLSNPSVSSAERAIVPSLAKSAAEKLWKVLREEDLWIPVSEDISRAEQAIRFANPPAKELEESVPCPVCANNGRTGTMCKWVASRVFHGGRNETEWRCINCGFTMPIDKSKETKKQ